MNGSLQEDENNDIKIEFTGLLDTLSTFRTQITILQNQVRGLERQVNKKVKTLNREVIKNKNRGNRKPSGFAVPTSITPELCKFMGKAEGSLMARTEVTKYIIGYIKENKLQKESNKKYINPDTRLNELLGVKVGEQITYFNIQGYMNKHFLKE